MSYESLNISFDKKSTYRSRLSQANSSSVKEEMLIITIENY